MRTIARTILVMTSAIACWLCTGATASGQVKVATYHNDNARTGQNVNETLLTPANVIANKFKKLFTGSVTLDSWAVAQPLYIPGVTIAGILHNVVYVATLNNSVYAFDADNGALLWTQNYGSPTPYMNLCHDSGFQSSPSRGAGIVGTPVIDPVAGTIYFVAKTGSGTATAPYALYLHAADITTGLDKSGSPVLISPTSGPRFYPQYQMNRPALLLSGGTVYVGLGSTGCVGLKGFPLINNHGWVLGYSTSNLAQLPSVFVTTPNTNNGGIWQSGGGLVGDSEGNIYFETADATFDQYLGGSDYGDSILKLDANLNLVDFFTPYNQGTLLDPDDLDLSSVGPVLLPDQTAGPTHLLVGSGKTEEVFLVNRDTMGGYCSTCTTTNSNLVQDIQRPSYLTGCQPPTSGVTTCRYGTMSYWNNTVYANGWNAPLLAYPLTNGTLPSTPRRTVNAYGGLGPASISANGASNGIAWVITWSAPPANNGTLRAFNAVSLTALYNSGVAPGGRDTLGAVANHVTPTIANGKVYVATRSQLVVYGLF